MSDDLYRVPADGRVRFEPQDISGNEGPEPWRTVRVVASRRMDPSVVDKVLVVFRMVLRFREALAAIAYCKDRPIGNVVDHLVRQMPQAIESELIELGEITLPRGRPSSTPDEAGFNRVVEVAGVGESYATQYIGHWVEQALYLEKTTIERIEELARTHQLSADQVLDVLVARTLSQTLGQTPDQTPGQTPNQ